MTIDEGKRAMAHHIFIRKSEKGNLCDLYTDKYVQDSITTANTRSSGGVGEKRRFGGKIKFVARGDVHFPLALWAKTRSF